MRCALLGSGSAGNATLVSAEDTHLLVDCGYSIRVIEERAESLNFDISRLSGILVTHEHDDHVSGVDALARRFQLPVYATHGTRSGAKCVGEKFAHWHTISAHEPFRLGVLDVTPVPVPHDAREPSQFVLAHDGSRLGILTDLGHPTTHVIASYRECSTLVIEFNHEPALLAQAAYPAMLKKRIASNYGHFSNSQALSVLNSIAGRGLRHVVAAHLSERTNHPDIVAAKLHAAAKPHGYQWSIAAQHAVTGWFDV